VPGLDRVVGEDAPHGRRRDRIGDPAVDDFNGEVQAGPRGQRHAVLGGQFAGQRYDLGPLHVGEQPRATRVPVRARCRLPRPSDRGIATTMGPTSVDAECASDLPVGLRATRVRPVAGRVCPGHGVAWPAPAGRLDEVARRRPGIGGRCRRGGAAWRWALAGWPTSANRAANIASAQLRHGRCRRAPHLALTAPGRRPAREKHQPPSEASLGPAELRGDAGRGARGAVVGGGAVRRRQHGVVAPETREPQETVRSLVPPVVLVDQCPARGDRVLAMHTLSSQAQRARPLGARQRLDRTANFASGGPQPAKQTPPATWGHSVAHKWYLT